MQSEVALTYNSSGVDIDENQKANRMLSEIVGKTLSEGVVSQPGFFSGAIRLNSLLRGNQNHLVCDSLSEQSFESFDLDETVKWFACLDYFAATPLKSNSVLDYVRRLANFCLKKKIAILGGETAEMPGVICKESQETVTHFYGLGAAQTSEFRILDSGFIYRGERLNLAKLNSDYPNSCLVMSSDGVGTKTVLASEFNQFDSIIGDILGHSQGDIACLGAVGVGVNLYLGLSNEELISKPNNLIQRVNNICKSYGLKLLELRTECKPEIYESGQIDLCGTIVGLVNESSALTGNSVKASQVCIALPSNGLHTNGFSLVRQILESSILDNKLELYEKLLVPHRNYGPYVKELLQNFSKSVSAIAHITGGGLPENLVRILPVGLEANLQWGSWQVPAIFQQLQYMGNVPLSDPENKGMLETFNMGVGMVITVDSSQSKLVQSFSESIFQTECPVIGIIQNGDQGVKFNGL
ncbi:MAG: AIR synthase-related protein [bacterium]|nr:AIR synthase-related protein [bacterium]